MLINGLKTHNNKYHHMRHDSNNVNDENDNRLLKPNYQQQQQQLKTPQLSSSDDDYMNGASSLLSSSPITANMDKNLIKTITKKNSINLVFELNYLGYLEIESKYLQRSIIPWLISELKLFELKQHINSIYCVLNANENLFYSLKPGIVNTNGGDFYDDYMNGYCDNNANSSEFGDENYIFKHKLTNIFKITQLNNDPCCFGYCYRDLNLNKYKLYAFRTNKINFVQLLIQLQHRAFKLINDLNKDSIKKFQVDYIGEVYMTNYDLNLPNLIDLCLNKLKKHSSCSIAESLNGHQVSSLTPKKISFTEAVKESRSSSTSSTSSITSTVSPLSPFKSSFMTTTASIFNKKKSTNENLNETTASVKRFSFAFNRKPSSASHCDEVMDADHEKNDASTSRHNEKRRKILLNFSKSKLIIENLNTNLLLLKLNYRKILYLNTSVLNQNYFCLAYDDTVKVNNSGIASNTTSGNTKTHHNNNDRVKVLIFYSLNNYLIDDLIKEFAYKLSNLNYVEASNNPRNNSNSISIDENCKFKRTCLKCPMQQYIQLCTYLNELIDLNKQEKIYFILNHIINKKLNNQDKLYLKNSLVEQNISVNIFNNKLCNNNNTKGYSNNNEYMIELNQILCSLIHKLCYLKQMQHIHAKHECNDEEGYIFNLVDDIYDVDISNNLNHKDKRVFSNRSNDCNDADTEHYYNNEYSNKENFDNNSNKLINSRKERLSLGNIYLHKNFISNTNNNSIGSSPTTSLLNNKKHLGPYNNNLLNFKRKSNTFDSDSYLANHINENESKNSIKILINDEYENELNNDDKLLSVSIYNNNNNSTNLPIASVLSPIQSQIQSAANQSITFDELQSTPNYNIYKKQGSMRRSIFNKVVGTPGSANASITSLNDESVDVSPSQRRRTTIIFNEQPLSLPNEYNMKTSASTNALPTGIQDPKILNGSSSNQNNKFKRFRTRHDIRQFWKKVISEQILLIKMDQENKKLKAKAMVNQQVPRRRRRQNMAFTYNEVETHDSMKDLTKSWKTLVKFDQFQLDDVSSSSTSTSSSPFLPRSPLPSSTIAANQLLIELEKIIEPVDYDNLRKQVLKGVPQTNRDLIWLWLAKQYNLRNQKKVQKNRKNLNFKLDVPYNELLKDNTTHQHAIMIDLGRTFPSHPNFSQQFGAGQLALFNVLKAYSILDPEVGYCQGLSFIVGVLLINCDNDEEKAFELLKHLLINLGLRKQFKPDMFALQKYMYEMTRLLYDYENQLYQHLEDNEASAQLYCAPWFLTLFASQFEMGFVSRVFDFLFSEGAVILFKISLAIINVHKALLMHCESFEVIINYLKITVPEMSLIQSEIIMQKAFNYDLQRDLDAYEIEFYIFQEELQVANNNLDANEDPHLRAMHLPSTITLAPGVRKDSASDGIMRNGSKESLSSNSNSNNNNTNASSAQIQQLEKINLKLKERIEDLLEQLQTFQVKKHDQEDMIYKLQHENAQLKSKVETLEMERMSLLNQLKEDRF